jgi:predicted nucleic acid-binding Zn ribbon protein
MLKIRCSECMRDFIWTDEMPLRGKCPNPDCDGEYDVRAALRKNLETREPAVARTLLCPACGGPIRSRWTICGGCDRIVAGSRAFQKRHLIVLTAVALLFLSLIIRVWRHF